jgi:hypothetical protein
MVLCRSRERGGLPGSLHDFWERSRPQGTALASAADARPPVTNGRSLGEAAPPILHVMFIDG